MVSCDYLVECLPVNYEYNSTYSLKRSLSIVVHLLSPKSDDLRAQIAYYVFAKYVCLPDHNILIINSLSDTTF